MAPLAALGAGFDPVATATSLRADPVTLVAGRDDVLLAGRVDDLAPAERTPCIDALNRHFAADGLVFRAARRTRGSSWRARRMRSTPLRQLAAVRGAIATLLAAGDARGTWRRWLSEMQMLLHEHPVNAEREAAGPRQRDRDLGVGRRRCADAEAHYRVDLRMRRAGRDGDVARGLARMLATRRSRDAAKLRH